MRLIPFLFLALVVSASSLVLEVARSREGFLGSLVEQIRT